MPLSDDEQQRLNQIEEQLSASDPRLAHIADTTLYRHSARIITWSTVGVVAGFVLMVATFTTTLALGIVGFLVMLVCLLVIERHARKIGRAGLGSIPDSIGARIRGALQRAEQQRRNGWRQQPPPA
jgi:predicted PurR-regulated permease PerM